MTAVTAMVEREQGKAEQAYETLRRAILGFELRGGQPVSERMLGDEVGSSRTSVRSALARLENEGLVRRSGRSYVVTPIDPDEIEQAHELLIAVEPAALMIAPEDGLNAKLDEMQGVIDRAIADPSIDTYMQAVLDYHSALVRLSGNAFFARASDDAQTRLVRAAWLTRWLDKETRNDWSAQGAIIEHMRKGERRVAGERLVGLLHASRTAMSALATRYRKGLLATGIAVAPFE